jgi:hypothetical protein
MFHYTHTLHTPQPTPHTHPPLTGAFIAQSFVGALSSRAFLLDKQNNALLYPTPLAGSKGLTGFITDAASVSCGPNEKTKNTELDDFDGQTRHLLHQPCTSNPFTSKPIIPFKYRAGLDATPFKPEEHMPSHVISTATPCNLADAPSDARFGGSWFLAGIQSPWAAMCVPVADPGTGEVLGCVMVEGKGDGSEFGYFGQDEVESMRSIAVQLAAAIKRCRWVVAQGQARCACLWSDM